MKRSWLIFLILLLACAVRLYHINFPVGGFAAWRQADTAAMAKNFFEGGYHLTAPQIDWGGNTPGYVETEFPVFSFLIALLYRFLGMSELWARLLAVACSCATVAGLYRLVTLTVDETVALWSAFFYAILPLNIFYGRAIMPDIMMLMCSVWGIYWFALWLENEKTWTLAASAVAIAFAVLLKLPALYLGLPLIYLTMQKYGARFFRRPWLWLYAFAIFIPVSLWYYHAHQTYLVSGLSFGIWDFGSGKWGNFSLLLTPKLYNDVFFKSIAERHLTYPGFFLFIGGLFIPWHRKPGRVFDWWLVGILVYIFIVARGNQVHEYYQLPFTLPAAVFIAKTVAEVLSSEVLHFYWQSRLAGAGPGGSVHPFLRYPEFSTGEKLHGRRTIGRLGLSPRQLGAANDL